MNKQNSHDVDVLRRLAAETARIAAKPVQDERRRLWSAHMAGQPTRVPVLARYGPWNAWYRELFAPERMECTDPSCRFIERDLRAEIFHDGIGDDYIVEPWFTVLASRKRHPAGLWGLPHAPIQPDEQAGAWKFDPPIKDWSAMGRLVAPVHQIDESATARSVEFAAEIFGDLLPIDVRRDPLCQRGQADISTEMARLRGLEQIMVDMYDAPDGLHSLAAFLRDAVLANQAAAEHAGDYSLTSQANQVMTYCDGLEPPQANVRPCSRRQLWCHCAAQEFALVSPAMHEEFLLRYQLPILGNFGLVAYGCCEDLTRKIDMLRQIPNLRQIAVSPMADLPRCAEQIGTDYVISWRPSPADMVSYSFDAGRIRRIIGDGLDAARGTRMHIVLKDIENVQGEPDRIGRWARIVRQLVEERT